MGFGSLDIALSGLKAAQRSLDVVSNNISNASTVGYTRKVLPQSTLIVDGQGAGVRSERIIRNVDATLTRDLWKQFSVSENYTVREAYLSRIQSFLGASDTEQAISFEVSKLADTFRVLSDSPENKQLQDSVVTQAIQTANKINDYAALITKIRNDTQTEISQAIGEINNALETIARLNIQIGRFSSGELSSADLEDQRDIAIKTVAKYLEVSTFSMGNNMIALTTRQGQPLADDIVHNLVFQPTTILPSSYYPGGGSAGVFLDSNTGTEITASNLGGRLGALLELRDEIMPQYQAQLDEFAQKMAYRFEIEGLRMFTDENGNVPANVADPGLVGYVGFSNNIRVNEDVLADHSLVQQGTTGAAIAAGSNEIVKRVLDFTFGEFEYEQATGTVNITVGTLFTTLGLTQSNTIIGNVDITELPTLDSDPNIVAGSQFRISTGGPLQTITINAGDTAINLVNNINTIFGPNTARLNGLGQLVFSATGNITISDLTLGASGIAALGHSFGFFAAQQPSFTVQAGDQPPITINIAPGDTSANLLADLNAVPGITATLGTGGELIITPTDGGSITLNDGLSSPLAAMGVTVAGVPHVAFRQNNLGPDGSISTNLQPIEKLEEYTKAFVSQQTEEHRSTEVKLEKEQSFLSTLEKRYSDTTGVDLDQEVADLVRLQTSYAAAARMVSASERLFDQLLAVFGA